jgi:hypothetical protein
MRPGDRRGAGSSRSPGGLAGATDDDDDDATPTSALWSVEPVSLLHASRESSSLERRGAKGGPAAVVSSRGASSSRVRGVPDASLQQRCPLAALLSPSLPRSQQEHHPTRRLLLRRRLRLLISAWVRWRMRVTRLSATGWNAQGESHAPVEVSCLLLTLRVRTLAHMRWSAAPFSSSSSSFALLFSPWETGGRFPSNASQHIPPRHGSLFCPREW